MEMRAIIKARFTFDVCAWVVWFPWSTHASENNAIRQKPTDLD